MTKSLPIIEQFKLCFNSIPSIEDNIKDKIINDFQLNKTNFDKILIKADFEESTELLWLFGIRELYLKNFEIYNIKPKDLNQDRLEQIIKYRPECISYNDEGYINIDVSSKENKIIEIELTELLIFLLEESENKINTVLKSNRTGVNFSTDNPLIINLLFDSVKNKFIEKGYDLTNLDLLSAENELLDSYDIRWIKEYFERFIGIKKVDDNTYQLDDFDELIDINNISDWINQDMINEYTQDHQTNAVITLQFLKQKLLNLKADIQSKPGAKAKNINTTNIVEFLLSFKRLEQFLLQDKVNDISLFPVSNKDCRLVHDYLVFFDLITDQRKNSNTTTPEAYIKSLINNRKGKKEYNNRKTSPIKRINDFKLSY